VDAEVVKSYAQDLQSLLEEADFTERKTCLRSFIKRIVVNKKQATIYYNLPIPPEEKKKQSVGVPPIVTLSGLWGTVPELQFEKKGLIPALQQLLTSYPNPTG